MLNAVRYRPETGSLAHRVCVWFQQHLEEELHATDIAMKFDVPRASVSAMLTSAVTYRLLQRERGVYRAGPMLDTASSAAEPAEPAEPPPPPVLPLIGSAPAASFDIAAVRLHQGVPLPSEQQATWQTLLGRMQVGDATDRIPRAQQKQARHAVGWWRRAERPGKFTVALVDDDHFRIWRTA